MEKETKTTGKKRTVPHGRIVTLQKEKGSDPAILFAGSTPPKKGEIFAAKLENGVVYEGEVADSVEADGEILVEFKNGIQPKK